MRTQALILPQESDKPERLREDRPYGPVAVMRVITTAGLRAVFSSAHLLTLHLSSPLPMSCWNGSSLSQNLGGSLEASVHPIPPILSHGTVRRLFWRWQPQSLLRLEILRGLLCSSDKFYIPFYWLLTASPPPTQAAALASIPKLQTYGMFLSCLNDTSFFVHLEKFTHYFLYAQSPLLPLTKLQP